MSEERPVTRRRILKGGLVLQGGLLLEGGLLASLAPAAGPGPAEEERPGSGAGVPLREKFFGCIAGCHIGSAMAAPVEGWPYEMIEREYGLLDKPLSYTAY